jgi:hypothetical protein
MSSVGLDGAVKGHASCLAGSTACRRSDRFGLATLAEPGTPIRQLLDAGIPTVLSPDNVPHSMLFAMQQALTLGRRLWPAPGPERADARGRAEDGHAGRTRPHVGGDDPPTCDEEAIAGIPVEQKWVNGRRVFPGA